METPLERLITSPQVTYRQRCTAVALFLAVVLVGGIAGTTWGLHGVLTEHTAPVPPDEHNNLAFLVSVLMANAGAVALAASGILTFGIGTLSLAPIVAANVGILMGSGQEWLSPEAFRYGLAVHGLGEAVAVTLGTAAGLHPILRMLPGLRDRSLDVGPISRYIHAVAETIPYLGGAAVILMASALWETFVSATLA